MKLFIWEGDGVLTDYSNGMIVALAPDLLSALSEIEKKASYSMQSFPTHKPSRVVELGDCSVKPHESEAWVCWGGG